MQQTSNYQLSQWDAEDRIQREDFNSDNAKVDAALKSKADTAAAARAAASAMEQKLGLQHIQTVNGSTVNASIFT